MLGVRVWLVCLYCSDISKAHCTKTRDSKSFATIRNLQLSTQWRQMVNSKSSTRRFSTQLYSTVPVTIFLFLVEVRNTLFYELMGLKVKVGRDWKISFNSREASRSASENKQINTRKTENTCFCDIFRCYEIGMMSFWKDNYDVRLG